MVVFIHRDRLTVVVRVSGSVLKRSKRCQPGADPSLRSTAAAVLGSSRNASKSMTRTDWTIMSMPSRMSRSESAGSLKGKFGLARGFGGNWLLEPFCRGEIYAGAQKVSEAVFDGDHVQER
jgi:hypothetical protein